MSNRLASGLLVAVLIVPLPAFAVSLTQSMSTTVQAPNSVSCNSAGAHTDNSYFRAFDLATGPGVPFTVTSVDVGIESAVSGGGVGQPMTVRLYQSSTNPPTFASLGAPLASADVLVPDQTQTILSVPISATFGASDVLVVEVFTPNGSAGSNWFLIGSNNLGQSAPSYIAAAPCGVSEITDLAAIGFPAVHYVMRVHGVTAAVSEPPMCAVSHATFEDDTAVPIVDVGVVTSTITVSGADPYLLDLNVQTFIPHTFAADLDVTLTSPAGTVVTLTTDNGAGNDNVFVGTVWDDDANPGGQVPYTTNNGLVTDNVYTNGVAAARLVPEEALGAFVGEDPNGVWTLTISDDLAGDTGTLDRWSLEVTALPEAPVSTLTSVANSTPVAIPTGPAVVSSTLNVSGLAPYLSDVDLLTTITHTFAADMDVTLMSPAGTVVTLSTDNGSGNDNTFNGTIWNDSADPDGLVPYTTNAGLATDHPYANLTTATPLVAEEALAAFVGEDPNGTWTLTISDDLAGDGGVLSDWTLYLTTGECSTTSTSTSTSTSSTTSSSSTTSTTSTSSTSTTVAGGSTTTTPGGATTTSTTLPAGGCPAGASYASLRCRLAWMSDEAALQVRPDAMSAKLVLLLGKADARIARAEEIGHTAGSEGRVRRALRKAMKLLKKVGRALASPAMADTPETVRAALAAAETDVVTDLRAMIGS